ncbi:hypothetical protein [Teredinibacter haidensis]|uniref:hypothetical protein n=1 Tax=Teredinibacter haidensis TaxID=2731755 RepID=UPI00094915D7|nr:hypothetical protein [Teredinibacter haidensis]
MQKNYTRTLFLLIAIPLNFVLFANVYWNGNIALTDENGLIENLQIAFYLGSAVVILFAIFRLSYFKRWLSLFFYFTCLTLFLRELETRDFALPALVEYLISGKGKHYLIAVTYILLTVHYFRHYRHLNSQIKNIFKSRIAKTVIIGCLFLVVGSLFEQAHMVLLEELLELDGSLLILMAACAYAWNPDKLTKNCSQPLLPRDLPDPDTANL